MKMIKVAFSAALLSLAGASSALADRASGSNLPVDETAITREDCTAKDGYLTRQAGDVYCAYVDASGTKRLAPLVKN